MEYIPGQMHQSLQKIFYIQIKSPFVIPLCNLKRFNELSDIVDWDNTLTFDLNIGDILKLRYFKPRVDSHVYTYVDSIIRNEEFIDIKKESIISQGFLELNLAIFEKLDYRIFEREAKINQILNSKS